MKKQFMKFRTSFLLIGMIELISSLIIQFIYYNPFSISSLIDGLSTISLLFLCTGLVIFVYQSGGFDGIVYSFKRFTRSTRSKNLGESDAEAPLTEHKHHDGKERVSITWPLIFDSLLLFIVSLIVSFL